MGKYMENEYLDVTVAAIVEKELAEYKESLKKKIKEHFTNPYCAKAGSQNVMHEKEIMSLVDSGDGEVVPAPTTTPTTPTITPFWNVILHRLDGNKLVPSSSHPKKSGRYLCTCVHMWQGEVIGKYLQVMEYDIVRNCWHDCGNKSGVSHTILAWTDKVEPCDFSDYDYVGGGYLVEKSK